MAFEFRLPDLAEGMTEAEVVSWKVKEGDVVALDQPLVEVMSDKATVEIPSPRAGTIASLKYKEGEMCAVGDVLFVIEEADGAKSASAGGTMVVAPSVLVTSQEVSPQAVAPVGTGPAVLDVSGPRSSVKATPATRRLARQMGVDLAGVRGTGRNGRITSGDVQAVVDGAHTQLVPQIKRPTSNTVKAVNLATTAPVAPIVARNPTRVPASTREERVPLRGMRKRIADNMARSTSTAAHFTYVEEIDVTELVEVRSRAKARAEERGIKLTYLPFIMKAVVAGLKKWPQLNAALDETTQEIVRKHYYHLGVAAQGPQGLMVTVVRNADQRSIFDLAAELARLGRAVQDGTATRDDLTGSTFTISSLGKLGGVLATPIINFPEVGILGVHKIEEKPAVRNGEIVIRSLMNLSISLDHRLVDGWDGAMFLQDVKSLLEDPNLMFMELV